MLKSETELISYLIKFHDNKFSALKYKSKIIIMVVESFINFLRKDKKGSPLVEESILLGLSLFAFMVVASIVFDLVDFAQGIFAEISDFTDNFP